MQSPHPCRQGGVLFTLSVRYSPQTDTPHHHFVFNDFRTLSVAPWLGSPHCQIKVTPPPPSHQPIPAGGCMRACVCGGGGGGGGSKDKSPNHKSHCHNVQKKQKKKQKKNESRKNKNKTTTTNPSINAQEHTFSTSKNKFLGTYSYPVSAHHRNLPKPLATMNRVTLFYSAGPHGNLRWL